MELKDYLHYYIGQRGFCEFTGRTGIITQVSRNESYFDGEKTGSMSHGLVKPILRKLADITEEEKDTICKIEGHETNDGLNIDFAYGSFRQTIDINKMRIIDHCYARDDESYYPLENPVMIFHYLLKQGFDLFGLIDAGLALDAKTLKL